MTRRLTTPGCLFLAVALASFGAVNRGFTAIPAALAPAEPGYADLADRYADAPLVLRARIERATPLKDAGVPPGITRFYVEGTVTVLIRGSGGVAPRVAWLFDSANDSRGKPPRLRKTEVLLAALPVAGRPGVIRLAGPGAQRPWSAPLEARIRTIVTAAVAPDAPPVITGIASAFHSPGTVIGEGETQIFLTTANKAPVSITILSRPGEAKRWAFAQGEIVDEAAEPPPRDTLAWYRLACFLPPTLPGTATAELPPADAEAARADYAFVMTALGDCPRTRQI